MLAAMLSLKNIFIVAFTILVFVSCKKATTVTTASDPVQYGTPFDSVPDTKDIAMYEINVPDFSASSDFTGVMARLDSIKALGINVIWLMPIYPRGIVNSINSPYCVRDYEAIDPSLGSLAQLRTLVDSAHSKGMSVILDWVADHTSWDNAWIANKSWYQQDSHGNIIPPVGSGYTDVAGLNYANTDLRLAMIKAMKYWILTANIDGYRCDYASGPPEDFWAAAIDSLKAIPNHKLILLAEDYHYTNFTAGFQICYGWNFSYQGLMPVFATSSAYTADTLASINQLEDVATLPPGAFMLRFTSNHDEDLDYNTPLVLFNSKQGSLSAFVLAAYMGGIPLIYDGQEVGCATKLDIFSATPIDWSTNPDMMQQYKLIMGFRKTSDAVRGGGISYFSRNNDVSAFERISGADTVMVIANVRNTVINYTLDAAVANTNWLDALNNKAAVNLGTSISLQPYEYMILSNN
jgi:glycosidase